MVVMAKSLLFYCFICDKYINSGRYMSEYVIKHFINYHKECFCGFRFNLSEIDYKITKSSILTHLLHSCEYNYDIFYLYHRYLLTLINPKLSNGQEFNIFKNLCLIKCNKK
jgi:hypothetical protein